MNGLTIITLFTLFIIKGLWTTLITGDVQVTKNKKSRLEELRSLPNKTIEQQKEFLDLRFKKQTASIDWFDVFVVSVVHIAFYLAIYKILIAFIPFQVNFGLALISCIVVLFGFNYLLYKLGYRAYSGLEFLRRNKSNSQCRRENSR